MDTIYRKIAAVLAFVIGAMTIFAGVQVVVFGKVMDYYVIGWLPVYNLILGLISVFFTAIVLWKGSKIAIPAAIATLASHSVVMMILQLFYQGIAAPDSVRTMTVRITFWVIILVLLWLQSKREKKVKG